MKYIITESQYNMLMEQPIGLAPVGGYEWQKPKVINKSFDQLKTLSVDDTVDVISAMIDGIPGVGNIVSLGIDVIHALSYFVRLFFADNENEKIEYAALGFLTLATSVIPIGGNSANLVARHGLKSVLEMTPVDIYRVGKDLGLLPDMMILFAKKGWKYKWLLVLTKIIGHEILEVLAKVSVKLKDTLKNIKKYKELNFLERPLVYVVDLIEEMKEFVPMALKLSE